MSAFSCERAAASPEFLLILFLRRCHRSFRPAKQHFLNLLGKTSGASCEAKNFPHVCGGKEFQMRRMSLGESAKATFHQRGLRILIFARPPRVKQRRRQGGGQRVSSFQPPESKSSPTMESHLLPFFPNPQQRNPIWVPESLTGKQQSFGAACQGVVTFARVVVNKLHGGFVRRPGGRM